MEGKRILGKRGHKKTIVCPIKKCNYTSRIMYTTMDNKLSNHSENCPHHQQKLIDKHLK